MSALHQFLYRLRALFRRGRLDEDMAEEMRFHLRQRAAENVADGMPAEEAAYAAQRKFGGVEQLKERARDERGFVRLGELLRNARFAVRMLVKRPGFTAVVVGTLALGIGANTAIFSLVKSVLLQPLPYPHGEQLLSIAENRPNNEGISLSWPSLQDYQRDNRAFAAIAGFRRVNYTLTGTADPEQVASAQVNAALFSIVGLPPQLGRYFSAEEDKPGAAGLVLLSDRLWRRRFAGDPSVLGREITMNGETFTVIGVLRPEFDVPPNVELVTMLVRSTSNPGWQNRVVRPGIFALGRMKPGITPAEAIADLKRISAQIERDNPQANGQATASGRLLFDELVGSYRRGLWLLLGAVALVLLIACANLANLLLVRGSARAAEFAVRAALGASRRQIVGQLMLENTLLAGLGGGLGILVAWWAHGGIAALSPAGVERFQAAGIDGSVLAVAAALCAFAVLAFGLWPAWKAGQIDLRAAMQAGGRGGTDFAPAAARAREMLVVAEVALTLMLLVGAGLLLRSLTRARAVDLGIDPRGVLTARLALPWRSYNSPEKVESFYERLQARLSAAPAITAVSFATGAPLAGGFRGGYVIDDQTMGPNGEPLTLELVGVSGDYFRALGIPLSRGRTFSPQDGLLPPDPSWGAIAPPTMERTAHLATVIIDQAFANRHWPGQDPVGKTLRLGGPGSGPSTIIGVVPTVRIAGYRVEPVFPQVYISLHQSPGLNNFLVVRGTGDRAALVAAVREAMREVDPNLPLSDVRMLEERIEADFGSSRLYSFLLSIFAGLALFLAALGLYGVLAHQVAQRRREFGIRIALGARAAQLATFVLGRGLRLIGLGIVVGLAGALAFNRALGALLYRTSAFDPGVIGGVTALLALVALVACWLPARRATKVDPMIALRAE